LWNHAPQARQEQIDVINVVNLFYERSQPAHEGCPVVVNNDIQINSMFPASNESLAIVAPVKKRIDDNIR